MVSNSYWAKSVTILRESEPGPPAARTEIAHLQPAARRCNACSLRAEDGNRLEVRLLKHQVDESSLVGSSPALTSQSGTAAPSSPPSHSAFPLQQLFPLGI